GTEALAQQRKVAIFDGEVPAANGYIYDEHYSVGDLVEIRTADGATKNVRVTEQIFTSDETGEKSIPGFTDVLYITPGSWLSWDYNQVWQDAGTLEWKDA